MVMAGGSIHLTTLLNKWLTSTSCTYTAQNIERNTAYFAVDHNTKSLIVRLITRVGLIRQKQVSPVISLVTFEG